METDAPYMKPYGKKGDISTPAYIADVVSIVAEARREPATLVASRTVKNARELFGL